MFAKSYVEIANPPKVTFTKKVLHQNVPLATPSKIYA